MGVVVELHTNTHTHSHRGRNFLFLSPTTLSSPASLYTVEASEGTKPRSTFSSPKNHSPSLALPPLRKALLSAEPERDGATFFTDVDFFFGLEKKILTSNQSISWIKLYFFTVYAIANCGHTVALHLGTLFRPGNALFRAANAIFTKRTKFHTHGTLTNFFFHFSLAFFSFFHFTARLRRRTSSLGNAQTSTEPPNGNPAGLDPFSESHGGRREMAWTFLRNLLSRSTAMAQKMAPWAWHSPIITHQEKSTLGLKISLDEFPQAKQMQKGHCGLDCRCENKSVSCLH